MIHMTDDSHEMSRLIFYENNNNDNNNNNNKNTEYHLLQILLGTLDVKASKYLR